MFQLTAARRRLEAPNRIATRAIGFQLTAARRRLDFNVKLQISFKRFQLTAARRRLVDLLEDEPVGFFVSTHSRPKAAGAGFLPVALQQSVFQLTAARRRLVINNLL